MRQFYQSGGTSLHFPTTVSAHIHQLEEELQTELFTRNGKLIALSAAGQEFLQYAYQIVKYDAWRWNISARMHNPRECSA